jgi:FkbM family methyltransferase
VTERMLKGLVFTLAKRLGYEIRGTRTAFARQRALASLLRDEKINLVLDVGANHGQFANEIRENGYRDRIISFEPLRSAHAELLRRAQNDPNWTIAERTAVGAESGTVEFHVSEDTVSSSVLDMLPTVLEAEPRARYEENETVTLSRLDDLCAPSPGDRVLLKVDVQGYEKHVLDGAPNILRGAIAVQIELSLATLYHGQADAKQLLDFFISRGFDIWSLEPVLRHPKTFQLMQLDGIFVRADR